MSGSAFCSASMRPLTASASAGLSGPWLEPEDAPALYGIGEVAEARLQKYFSSLKGWPISAEPTALPSRSTRLPFACVGKTACAMPVTISG